MRYINTFINMAHFCVFPIRCVNMTLWKCAVGWAQTQSFTASSVEQRNQRSSRPSRTTWELSLSLITPSPREASRLISSLVSWLMIYEVLKELQSKYNSMVQGNSKTRKMQSTDFTMRYNVSQRYNLTQPYPECLVFVCKHILLLVYFYHSHWNLRIFSSFTVLYFCPFNQASQII